MEYRKATTTDLEYLWNKNIAENPENKRWLRWKQEFIEYNQSGQAITFCIVSDGLVIGEGTLLLSSECKAVSGRKELCNDKDIANINALRIQKEYEGRGYISRLMKEIENYAFANHISMLTIGVEAKETRNLAIYLHWGFTEFICSQEEGGELVLYFGKRLYGKMEPTIKRVRHGSPLEKQLALFIQNFSWDEVKEHLLWELENWNHEDWESFFAAVSDEKIIGMISIFKEDYYPLPEIFPWLSSIFVSEDHRGQGICGQMIEYVNAYARERGFQKTYIPSIHTGLYEKYGYVYLRDIVNYSGDTDRLYVRELL